MGSRGGHLFFFFLFIFTEILMNHKRGKPKNARAGCLMCKPHKGNGMKTDKHSIKKLKERFNAYFKI